MAKRNEVADVVTRELQLAGIDYQIENGSKHPRIQIRLEREAVPLRDAAG